MSIAAISACGTAPTLPDLNLPEPGAAIAVEQAVPLCRWPDPVEIQQDGVDYAAYDRAGFAMLLMCQETEIANHAIAAANADTAAAYRELLQRGREYLELQHEIANYKLSQEYEKGRDHWLEAQAYKLAVVIAAIAGAL